MAIQKQTLTRVFKYGSLSLKDPAPGKSVDQVKAMLTIAYPELANASLEQPVTNGNKLVYEFKRAVGTKG